MDLSRSPGGATTSPTRLTTRGRSRLVRAVVEDEQYSLIEAIAAQDRSEPARRAGSRERQGERGQAAADRRSHRALLGDHRALSGRALCMSATIVDGKAVAAELRAELAAEVAAMARAGNPPPSLAVVLCGDDPASAIYVRNKGRAAERAGVTLHAAPAVRRQHHSRARGRWCDRSTPTRAIDGILVQLPLPQHIDAEAVTGVHLAGEGRRRLPPVQLRAPRGGASRGGRPGNATRLHGAAAAERRGDPRAAGPWSSGGAPSSGARSR